MPAPPDQVLKTESSLSQTAPGKGTSVLAWSSFLFAVLQSVCTFFAALDGLRLVIGAGALALAVQAGTAWDHYFHHADWVRRPMIFLALIGALLNLAVLLHMRYLRHRPAAQWRIKPLTPRQIRMERTQLGLSFLTLALIAGESLRHFYLFHRL